MPKLLQVQNTSIRLSTRQKITRIVGGGIAAGIMVASVMFTMKTASTSISGVVNSYSKVTETGYRFIRVQNPGSFTTGDKVLVIQMKGAQISQVDDDTYGSISDYGESGNYEFAEVQSVSTDTLHLTRILCRTYDVTQAVQLVKIPVYSGDVSVDGEVTATAWNGITGGIVAFEATGKLTLNAPINVQSRGFRGGELNSVATSGGLTYICEANSGKGGIKGEGIIELAQAACRGALGNGGGGGNDHNAGGGGGGNYGEGGMGGHGWKSNTPGNLSDLNKGGRGGKSLSTPYDSGVPKLFLGGGGGAGHQNNGHTAPASPGSGIVILIANSLQSSTGTTIRADGLDAQDVNYNDGAGGGGAGGSVLLDIQTWINPENLSIDVSGGDGGTITTNDQHGPGGGGGGGYINTTSTLPGAITVNLSGGAAGLFITSNVNNPLRNTTHGAVNGQPGAIVSNLTLSVCSEPPVIDLDMNSTGVDATGSYSTNSGAMAIFQEEKVGISDADDTYMASMEITLTNPDDGEQESLSTSFSTAQFEVLGIDFWISSSGHQIRFSGNATIAAYREALASITYQNASPSSTLQSRIFNVYTDDGGAQSNTAQLTLSLSGGVFPVEYLSLEANWTGTSANVEWVTAWEQNAAVFEVQRSLDGKLYEMIGEQRAAGDSQVPQQYIFTDNEALEPGRQILYYRLKQVDIDGGGHLSSTVELRVKSGMSANEGSLSIWPNPASEMIEASWSGSIKPQKLVIVDMKAVIGVNIPWPEKANSLQVPISQLAPGMYVVQAVMASGKPYTAKLIKQ